MARQVFPVYGGTLASNPADLYRRWLVQDLLLSQAQRTLDDHWYSEEATAPQPYYRSAGLVYLDDVKRLAGDILKFDLDLPRRRRGEVQRQGLAGENQGLCDQLTAAQRGVQ